MAVFQELKLFQLTNFSGKHQNMQKPFIDVYTHSIAHTL